MKIQLQDSIKKSVLNQTIQLTITLKHHGHGRRLTVSLLLVAIFGVMILNSGDSIIEVIALQAKASSLPEAMLVNDQVFLPLVASSSSYDWPMLAANPQRTSWTAEEIRGSLHVEWYRPIEPYIPYKIQPIAANGKLYISTARGLYAFRASDGDLLWVYPTEVPLGHSPTIATINGRSIAYVGGYDRKIHAIDANSGEAIPGYSPFEANAGFETNPLIINNAIYAGNRDGYFYALNAVNGSLKWKYKTEGPILFSAAYKNGVVYFASNDAHAYALSGADGSLIWKSLKFPGAGFHSFWPVIYTEKLTNKDYVIFSGAENYRQSDHTPQGWLETEYFFPGCHNIGSDPCPPDGTLIGPPSSAPSGDSYWLPGTSLIDVNVINDYYEDYGFRRTVFVLDSQNGQEYTFDSDGDGKSEYAPFTWSGVTTSGNKYPPVINHVDKIIYDDTVHISDGWTPRGDAVGWQFGTHTISRVAGGHAVNEPMAFSSGGKLIYWSLCCDREAGAFDITIPYGQSDRRWSYYGYDLLKKARDYRIMYKDGDSAIYNNGTGWQAYSGRNESKNGFYGQHGTTQSPPIPYQGKVYFLRGNALLAFSPEASAAIQLPLAPTVSSQSPSMPPPSSELKQRLESEIGKMLSAGHLRPGYHSAGFIDLFGQGGYPYDREYGEIFDYFQNPAETIVTLIQTLPHLSPTLQGQVKTYLQTYYGPSGQFPFTSIIHIGWKDGAPREVYDIPQDMLSLYTSFDPRTTPRCSKDSCGWQAYPPYSFYAALMYAQTFGNAKSLFDQISGKLETPPADDFFIGKPYVLNQYIAGYFGYLELQKLAGYPESTLARNTYNYLLSLRSTDFSKDVPWGADIIGLLYYKRALSVAANFMYLTPELGNYLNQNALTQVTEAIDEYNDVDPYWFVSKFDDSYGEGTFQHLYDYPALFQAKAYILKQPYEELVKWLDVPAFYRGDLFYIQNLVAALNASPSP